MIHLDTSVLIDALTGPRRSAGTLREFMAGSEPVNLCSIVLFEWLRGFRIAEELQAQEALFPADLAVAFGPLEASIAARLYLNIQRPRGREGDIAIAACAIGSGAKLWTLNPRDFRDLPGLTLIV